MKKIKLNKNDKFNKLTFVIYQNYKNISEIEQLLSQIVNIINIPIELLYKYWARVYTSDDFHYDLNEYLRKDKTGKYTLFIKVMYEGIKIKALENL